MNEEQAQPTGFNTLPVLLFYLFMSAGAYVLATWLIDVPPWHVAEEAIPIYYTVAIGAGIGITVVAIDALIDHFFAPAKKLTQLFEQLIQEWSGIDILIAALCSAVAEELLFRGFLLPWIGWLASSLIFGALHWAGWKDRMWIWTVMATIMGFAFAAITLWTGSILAAIVAHFTINYFNMSRIATRVRQKKNKEILA